MGKQGITPTYGKYTFSERYTVAGNCFEICACMFAFTYMYTYMFSLSFQKQPCKRGTIVPRLYR